MQHRPVQQPHGFHRRIPLRPDQMTAETTDAADVIVLCHLGVPQLSAPDWSLTIDGLVRKPRTLSFADLQRFPIRRVESVHQCAGIPTLPSQATRRVSNVVWGGVRLSDVLGEAGVDSSAKYLWSTGADWGAFEGIDVAAYQKDLPLPRALSDDVLLAFAMNGRPLAAEHGFPVRLVVPGFFGTNSVKWLTRMTLADRRADSAFVTRWYNDPVRDAAGTPTAATRPVWSLHPEAIIVAPAPDAQLAAGKPATIWGWAWGDGAIAKVEVRTGDGQPWQPAGLAPRRQRAWQRFSIDWTPEKTGPTQIAVRATSVDSETQPEAEWRNCWHRVGTTVI